MTYYSDEKETAKKKLRLHDDNEVDYWYDYNYDYDYNEYYDHDYH